VTFLDSVESFIDVEPPPQKTISTNSFHAPFTDDEDDDGLSADPEIENEPSPPQSPPLRLFEALESPSMSSASMEVHLPPHTEGLQMNDSDDLDHIDDSDDLESFVNEVEFPTESPNEKTVPYVPDETDDECSDIEFDKPDEEPSTYRGGHEEVKLPRLDHIFPNGKVFAISRWT
jgi:hypothetical protein